MAEAEVWAHLDHPMGTASCQSSGTPSSLPCGWGTPSAALPHPRPSPMSWEEHGHGVQSRQPEFRSQFWLGGLAQAS